MALRARRSRACSSTPSVAAPPTTPSIHRVPSPLRIVPASLLSIGQGLRRKWVGSSLVSLLFYQFLSEYVPVYFQLQPGMRSMRLICHSGNSPAAYIFRASLIHWSIWSSVILGFIWSSVIPGVNIALLYEHRGGARSGLDLRGSFSLFSAYRRTGCAKTTSSCGNRFFLRKQEARQHGGHRARISRRDSKSSEDRNEGHRIAPVAFGL